MDAADDRRHVHVVEKFIGLKARVALLVSDILGFDYLDKCKNNKYNNKIHSKVNYKKTSLYFKVRGTFEEVMEG
jgi:hypothetical protein